MHVRNITEAAILKWRYGSFQCDKDVLIVLVLNWILKQLVHQTGCTFQPFRNREPFH